jgi:hypothetical protein
MSEETKTTDAAGLVGSTPNPDPAAKLDPAKVEPKPAPKPRAKRKASPKKRQSAATAASRAKSTKATTAADVKASADDHAIAVHAEGTAAYEAAQLHRVDTFGDMPLNVEDFQLRFASHGGFIDGAIELGLPDLTITGGRASVEKEVNFAPEAPFAHVGEAWLVASSGEAVCCDLHVGLVTGGGHQAKIPAGHLLF